MPKFLASLAVFTLFVLSASLSHAVEMSKRRSESLSPGASSQEPTMKDFRQVPVGEPKTVRGKVIHLGKNKETIQIETAEGKERSYVIDPHVSDAKLRNIETGDNVMLEVADRDGTQVATSVQKQG